MKPPYFIIELKADLSFDDCIQFLNAVTEEGKKQFRNLYVALPLSRLQEITKAFPDAGITFGVALLNQCVEGAFPATVAGKLVKHAQGQFALVGSKDERPLADEEIKAKLFTAHAAGLKVIYCMSGESAQDLEVQLHVLKESHWESVDAHPLLIYELPFTSFKSYLPSEEEIQQYVQIAKEAVQAVFGEEGQKIALIAALPNDLVGFTSLIEKIPFAGAFFIKSGIYPHAVHQETIKLFHVHCLETESPIVENG